MPIKIDLIDWFKMRRFDSNLRFVDLLKQSAFFSVYKVEKDGSLYVFKMQKLEERKFDYIQHESNVLGRADDVEGITHLVEHYGVIGGYAALLKEYAEGNTVDKVYSQCDGSAIMSILKSTVEALHVKGIANVDMHSGNVVISPDYSRATTIDLNEAVFLDIVGKDRFTSAILDDEQDLYRLQDNYLNPQRISANF